MDKYFLIFVPKMAAIEAGLVRLRETTLAGGISDDALRASVATLQRCEAAVHAERLRRVAEVGARGAYLAAAHRSTAGSLAEVCGLTAGEARQQTQPDDDGTSTHQCTGHRHPPTRTLTTP